MKNYVVVLVIILISCVRAYGQIEIKIEAVQVASIKSLDSDKVSLEGYDGPYVLMECSFTNISDKEVNLHPIDSEAYLRFKYHDRTYRHQLVGINYSFKESLKLKSSETLKVTFGGHFLSGTYIQTTNEEDYTKEVFEILPSFSFLYEEAKRKINFESNVIEVNKVIVETASGTASKREK
ncbi:hypothetical protein ACFSKU_08740 [Pontibacter silvestris]|uniref:DUF4352 domain-containing protein n=1 Tax=Pontibacter silvestris TaxID=2305183 RepID=A0ABW4WWD5_9BACT|nr:hypothetical protein [Pontibacter silvestris]MCC9138778.1 hypothetical protein [Pontibacter silvestris]